MRKMTKLSFNILLVFGFVFTVFNSCKEDEKDNAVIDENVVPAFVEINGVKWASFNVNTPGTFTNKVEDAGCSISGIVKYLG